MIERLKAFLYTEFETDWARGEWARIATAWNTDGSLCETVSDPEVADAIIVTLVDLRSTYANTVEALKRLPLWRNFRDKVFVFDTMDMPAGLFPGFYASLRRAWFSNARHRTCCFFQSFNEFIELQPLDPRPPLLFSFQGNLTSPVRERLLDLRFGRSDVLIERTEPFWSKIGAESTRPFKKQYADTIRQSRFVLCPRGNGTSSYRLFETMQSGRVPVIIADHWVPSETLSWDTISIRVRENEIGKLPEICEGFDDRWPEMAQEARRAWDTWFSPQGLARLVCHSIAGIRRSRRLPERWYSLEWPVREGMIRTRRSLVQARILGLGTLARLRRGFGGVPL